MSSTTVRRVLIYGGKGALGSVCVQFFKKQNWWVTSVDLVANSEANENIVIKSSTTDQWTQQEAEVVNGVGQVLGSDNKLDAIVCVAGGWAGGSAAADDFVKNTDLMIRQSLWSSVISAKLAAKYLSDGGLLALTGARAALEPTPGMIGYGLAKSAVHHLVQSLSQSTGGLPTGATVVAILPVTFDTPMNRKFMPKADTSQWTPLEFAAELMWKWASAPAAATDDVRPKSGSLVQLITKSGETELVVTAGHN
ncbi:dihydropteridine reductase-like [Oppia nitens]|uniref:dihydropteridine reductase-like n=1 Tax=Oppia nitens TaxID=1686743 RepID=UPI0023DC723D|nr:dihydropteridine reductase-like [Oppia nitens]